MQKANLQLSQIQSSEGNYVRISHTEKLRQVLSKINFFNQSIQSDHISVLMPLKEQKISVQGIELQVHLNYLMSISENQKYLFLLFACKQDRESFNNQSKIVVWQFRKQNGQNRKLQCKGIKGKVSFMRLDQVGYLQKDKQYENKAVIRYKFCLIIGTVQGYLKVIEMSNNSSIRSIKLSTLNKIIQIIPFQRNGIELNAFYLVLLQNNQINLVNILNLDIMCRFCPRILHSKAQNALSISQSKSDPQYLYQSTKRGYIIIWQISDPKLNENMKKSQQNKFRSKNIVQTVFPQYLSHELSLKGLLFMHIFGTLVLIVDKMCFLRFFSINLNDRMDFIQILTIQLPYMLSSNEMNLIEEDSQNQKQKLYDEDFENTFQNFKFSEVQQTLYFLLEKQKHSIYKLKLNQYMEYDLLEKIKIKNKSFKKIDQFVVNEDGLFLIVRNKTGFAIKYFQDQNEKEQNQKDITNISKPKDKKKRKQEEVQY